VICSERQTIRDVVSKAAKKVPTHRPATRECAEVNAPKAAEAGEDLHEGDGYECHETCFVVVVGAVNKNPQIKPAAVENHERKNGEMQRRWIGRVQRDALDELVHSRTSFR
jgi:hypothetical protein